MPRLVGPAGRGGLIRVWSAGCASGEEAYSIAMLLAEAIGLDAFRERVKIYATDVDEEALNQARHAIYGPRAVEDVPAPLLEKYFERQDDRYIFNKELRRSVIFGRHDLIQDAPISRVDLLICRNCLMYFNTEAQARILSRFHFALVPTGVLFLGKAETLLAQSATFEPVDVKRRLFVKTRAAAGGAASDLRDPERARRHAPSCATPRSDVGPVAQLVVDRDGMVVARQSAAARAVRSDRRGTSAGRCRTWSCPIGPSSCAPASSAPTLERRPISAGRRPVDRPAAARSCFLELTVVPLLDPGGGLLGASIHSPMSPAQRRLQEEVQRASQELETALEELQSTNEELETTNEELQSTVEELETTNEELQSTNEELETMNEELQSTNEELQTINEEARERGDQLGELNGFLESILTSLRSAVAVVDRDLHVRKWSRRAEDMWGLRPDEVLQKNFLNLDIGLPVDRLRAPIRACLAGESEFLDVTLDATNRRGRPNPGAGDVHAAGSAARPTGRAA